MQDNDLATVEALERRLLDPWIRSSRENLNSLIADEFIEFGASGREWTKAEILDALPQEESFNIEIRAIKSRKIDENTVLVTYRSKRTGEVQVADSLRSSIWQRQGESWRVVFHQGTPSQP